MTSPIVCGVDGSPSSEGLAHVARALSSKLERSLVFVHVVDEAAGDEKIAGVTERLEQLTSHAHDVDRGARWLLEVGHPADRLVAAAVDLEASMIVVGSHGPRSSVLGSVSSDVSRHAPCPVVIVPPGAESRLDVGGGFPGGIVRFGSGSAHVA